MKRKGILMILTIVALLAFPCMAFADDLTWDTLNVEYNGEELVSDYSAGDVAAAINDIQPGDTMTLKVVVTNSSDKDISVWMSNSILQSLEDNGTATDGAYTYRLTSDRQEEAIYDSMVGGSDTTGGVGLYQTDNALEEFFYLTDLAAGDSTTVTLVISLDGNTQGNTYQEATATIALEFAVEEAATTNPPTPTPHTGDEFPLLPVCLVTGISGLVLLALALGRMRRAKGGEANE